MLHADPKAPTQIKIVPITYPLRDKTDGRVNIPAPRAEEVKAKILPLTLPAVTEEKVLSLRVLLSFELGLSSDIGLFGDIGNP